MPKRKSAAQAKTPCAKKGKAAPTLRGQAEIGTQYSVTLVNSSNRPWKFFVYQTPPPDAAEAVSLAWIASPFRLQIGAKITFNWEISYQFMWAESGVLQPGVTFDAVAMKDANLVTANTANFTLTNNSPNLSDPAGGGTSGTLTINDGPNVPPNQYSVGVAMSNKGAFAVDADANLEHFFTPNPMYWVCAIDEIEEGQVMNIKNIAQCAKFKFPSGVFSMTGTLNSKNLWEFANE